MASPLFVIPSYAQQETLDAVLEQLRGYQCVVIDDASPIPLRASCTLIRHHQNSGYGAAQKSAFTFALEGDWDPIVLVHGDNQYEPRYIIPELTHKNPSAITLGSRFLHADLHQMPLWRKLGNRFLTQCANRHFSCDYTDLHTGARIYTRSFLENLPFLSFSNDFVFDQQVLIWALQHNYSLREFPFPSKYHTSVSSISFSNAVRYGLGCLYVMLSARPTNAPTAP